jgi:hypothetical protein
MAGQVEGGGVGEGGIAQPLVLCLQGAGPA